MNLLQRILKFVAFFGIVEITDAKQKASLLEATPGRTAPDPLSPHQDRTARRFASNKILDRLPTMSRQEIDGLGFGCVQVADDGKVQIYNKWESDFAGVPQEKAVGVNFFRELAP
ncbi:MAG: hypothetical protein H7Z41_10145, partial [Cytophagales bacterium]|nr:hypothetical protein [Armatimonadota bacterium]